jgi:hypothetical protein
MEYASKSYKKELPGVTRALRRLATKQPRAGGKTRTKVGQGETSGILL